MTKSVLHGYWQYKTQSPKIPSAGGMIHKGHVLEAIEVQDTAVTVWHIFGHFWQLVS